MPKPIPTLSPSAVERFWSKVTKTDKCWIWCGTRDYLGRQRFKFKQEQMSPKRVAFHLIRGHMDCDTLLINKCGTEDCVNPDCHDEKKLSKEPEVNPEQANQ